MHTGHISGSAVGRLFPTMLVSVTIVALSLALMLFPLGAGVAALGTVLFLGVAVLRPVLGLAAVCLLLTMEGVAGSSAGITEVHLAGAGAFAAWVLHMFIFGKSLRVNHVCLMAFALTLWAGITFLWAMDKEGAGRGYLTLIQLQLLFLMVINVIETRRDLVLVLGAIVLGALATSGSAILIFTENYFERARVFEAQNANAYAAAVGLGIIAAAYFVLHGRFWWSRVIAFAAACGLGVPLMLAQSRSAWMGTGAALAVFLWHTRHRWRNMLLVTGTALALLTGIYLSGMVNLSMVDRAVGMVQLQDRGSDRLDIWLVAGRMIREHPVGGVGFKQFSQEYNSYRARTPEIRHDQVAKRDPHSLYFGVAAEMGVVGLVLLLLLFWSLWRGDNLPSEAHPGFARSMLVYLMMYSVGGTTLLAKFAWIALGLAARARVLPAREARGERAEE